MPKIYRTMLADGGKPKVGSESKMLGVRIAPTPRPDIPVDQAGNVHPDTGGMSVVPDWRELPYFLVPMRLKAVRPDARGSNQLTCWSLGEGLFEVGSLADKLVLRPDSNDPTAHGFVEPSDVMSIENYQEALAETQDQWVIDET
jgi:hypothetical protein